MKKEDYVIFVGEPKHEYLYVKILKGDSYSFDSWTKWEWNDNNVVVIWDEGRVIGAFNGTVVEYVVVLTGEKLEGWRQD